MKVLVLAGSPHKNGTSNTLVNEFIKGTEDSGKEVEVIDLARVNLHPCLGCDYCGMDGDCCQKDDGNIYGKGCGTVNMMPKSYYKEAYELGKNI